MALGGVVALLFFYRRYEKKNLNVYRAILYHILCVFRVEGGKSKTSQRFHLSQRIVQHLCIHTCLSVCVCVWLMTAVLLMFHHDGTDSNGNLHGNGCSKLEGIL